eukprot:1139904-Pelagomonas_calceolata.AAC.1
MHAKYRLGYADCKAGYSTYYQSLLPHANKGINNAVWNIMYLNLDEMRNLLIPHRHPLQPNTCSPFRKIYKPSMPPPRMVTEHHNIASRKILKVVSKGSYGSNLIHMDVGSADRLAQHDVHITEQTANHVIPPYLFKPSIPDQTRRNSSRSNAILVTHCPTNPNRPPTPPSHWGLRSMRRNEVVRSSTTPDRQLL